MGWSFTLWGAGTALGLLVLSLVLSGFLQARRGIGRLSFVPWDYVMILSALLLLAALVRMAILWRDGWPFPGTGT